MHPAIKTNFSLRQFNTFGVEAKARAFIEIESPESLREVLRNTDDEPWILGGGSNILLTKDIDKLVLKNSIRGIRILEEQGNDITISVGSGVEWHSFVLWAVERNYGGVENLALIPGCAGAAPIQNIGAYGVELKDTFQYLEAIDLRSGEEKNFTYEECRFGYRNSILKLT